MKHLEFANGMFALWQTLALRSWKWGLVGNLCDRWNEKLPLIFASRVSCARLADMFSLELHKVPAYSLRNIPATHFMLDRHRASQLELLYLGRVRLQREESLTKPHDLQQSKTEMHYFTTKGRPTLLWVSFDTARTRTAVDCKHLWSSNLHQERLSRPPMRLEIFPTWSWPWYVLAHPANCPV